jgi:signal recognition particle receptor subunit beta
MSEYKIVFTGAPGAGKTTAIGAISDTPPIVTEVKNSDPRLRKEMTTVGMDFGEIDLGQGERVRLFGTPGQERFDFMWRVLARNALGIIFLADNSSVDPVGTLMSYVKAFHVHSKSAALAVGVGRTETHPSPAPDDYVAALATLGVVCPVLAIDVRSKDDVLMLVDAVLTQREASLHCG